MSARAICDPCFMGKHCNGHGKAGNCYCWCANVDDIPDDKMEFFEREPGWGEG